MISAAFAGSVSYTRRPSPLPRQEPSMTSEKGPNIKKKQKCKNCEGKGLLKKGDKVVKCQRCKGTGVRGRWVDDRPAALIRAEAAGKVLLDDVFRMGDD